MTIFCDHTIFKHVSFWSIPPQVTYKEVQGFILLMLSNASINPLIYFLLNKEFRLAAKSLFFDSAATVSEIKILMWAYTYYTV